MTKSICSMKFCVPQPLFNFNAEHNGIECIASMRPEDRGTEHQYWFTRQMLAKEFDITAPTVTNHVEALVNRGVLTVEKNFATVPISNSAGAVNETTLYDLRVFNYLAMRLDTDKAWEKKARFNDVLVSAETQPPTRPIPRTFPEALRAYADEVEAHEVTKKALETEKQEREEERQEYSAYVDVLNEQKAQINDTRTATIMSRLSANDASYKNLRSAIRQDADGQLPQVVKGFFSTNDLFNLPWFVSLFKASVTKFCNGNPNWTDEKRAIRKGLTKKLNEIVISCLHMDMKGVAKGVVRSLFREWKESTKMQAPMIITDDMTEHEALFRSAVGRLICVADRYQYRDKYNDLHSEPIYGYSYEVIALCLESLPESSCLKYLRDEVEIEDLRREIARVSHDGYELYQVK